MADCREQVYSDEFFDFIVSYEETNEQTIAGSCIQRIDEGYDIFYYPREGLPPLSVGSYSYSEIPKCYGLLDQTAGVRYFKNAEPARSRLKGKRCIDRFY